MAKYRAEIYEKVTMWVKRYVEVEADSKNEAYKKILNLEDVEYIDSYYQFETEEGEDFDFNDLSIDTISELR